MKFSDERTVEGFTPEFVVKEHIERYRFAAKFVAGKTVLDIASGSGFGSRILLDSGATEVIGGDLSEEAVRYAEHRYGCNNLIFKVLNAEKIELGDESLDLVVAFETIEHVQNFRNMIYAVKRILKPGGMFICSSPNKKISSPFISKPPNKFHVREFTINQLSAEIIDKGFEIKGVYGQCFFNYSVFLKIKIFIKLFFPFLSPLYQAITKKTAPDADDDLKDYLQIHPVSEKHGLEPGYFILVCMKTTT